MPRTLFSQHKQAQIKVNFVSGNFLWESFEANEVVSNLVWKNYFQFLDSQ